VYALLDRVGWVWVLLATSAAFVVSHEVAYRLAARRKSTEAERAQTDTIAAALLAVLGLLLAFTFSIVEERYLERKQLVLAEANAIGTTYLRAGLLPAPEGGQSRGLLRRYVAARLALRTPGDLPRVLAESERLHRELWAAATEVGRRHPDSEVVALFIDSLNQVIDLHESRWTVAVHHRLPPPLLNTMLALCVLSMGVLGLAAGQARARTPSPTLALVLAAAMLVTVIIEMDRPWQRIFAVSRDSLSDVAEMMRDGA
jgi:hypothetical protein